MRFLFVLRSGVLKVFEAPVRGLHESGDDVLVRLEDAGKHSGWVDPVASRMDGITIGSAAEGEFESRRPEAAFERRLRRWIDYLRFYTPELEGATRYREQRGRTLPEGLRAETDRAVTASPELRRALAAGLRAVERALPVPDRVMEQVEEDRPDAVVVSPLFGRNSHQVLYLRAARRLGIPTALCVASWDNLPSKGVLHEIPDLVTVWNHAQREEAERLHGVPPDRIAVTGAPRFDEWFEHGPTESREEYCARLGLPPDRPHILYVGSTTFKGSLHEGTWISRWISELRATGHPELRDVPVVVRPHPKRALNGDAEGARQLAATPGLVVHPPDGAAVVDEGALSDFFDSLHHAAVVVGINTSAMIEAAILERGVHVLLAEPYRAIQQDCPHFDHLRTSGDGLIVATETMEEHARGVARALRGDDAEEAAERARSFLADFIRPNGLDRPVTPIMVDALRELGARPRMPAGPEVGDLADELRSLLFPEPRRPERRRQKKPRAARKRGPKRERRKAERADRGPSRPEPSRS